MVSKEILKTQPVSGLQFQKGEKKKDLGQFSNTLPQGIFQEKKSAKDSDTIDPEFNLRK